MSNPSPSPPADRTVIYDISRLVTRFLNPTPNGIDRIDAMLARRFLDPGGGGEALLFGFGGPRIVGRDGPQASALSRWREEDEAAGRQAVARLAAILDGDRRGRTRVDFAGARAASALTVLRLATSAIARYGLAGGRRPGRIAGRGAIYLNATHFPVEWARHMAWLDGRPDIASVLFVHDLLPITHPQYFWKGEPERHARRLAFLARRGAAALVTNGVVEEQLKTHLARLGRATMPVFSAPPPVARIFRQPCAVNPGLEKVPFFVACGTIEPRKNHLFLVAVWRALVQRLGDAAPCLMIVGRRGWNWEPIVEAIHAADLRGRVVEISGLPTPAYRQMLGAARALLAPSHEEGFGLPVAEALAAGCPVIASDIPAHRAQSQSGRLCPTPLDIDAWAQRIVAALDAPTPRAPAQAERCDEDVYMDRLNRFFETV